MLSSNDLYDLCAVFINIRMDIRYKPNSIILDHLILAIKESDCMYEDNKIRKALSSIDNLSQNNWEFLYHYNVYVQHRMLKNETIYKLLICVCEKMKELLSKKEYQQAYDLVDAIHCLPEIIVDNNFHIPKTYWKTHIKTYRKKWDKNFLSNEQKQLYRHGHGTVLCVNR